MGCVGAWSVEVSHRDWALLAAGGLAALSAPTQVVVAAEYLTVEQAQKSLFPAADRFDEVVLALNPAQKQAVAALAGPQPPHRSLRSWKAFRGGWELSRCSLTGKATVARCAATRGGTSSPGGRSSTN